MTIQQPNLILFLLDMPYTMPASRSSGYSQPTERTQLLFRLINQLNLNDSELSDVILHLSSVIDMRQQPIIADDYDLSAQPDASDSENDEDSDGDMPALISDVEDEEEEEEQTGPNPESLVFVNGETRFVKDITDHDVNELMSDAEYRAYMSLYPASDSESDSEHDSNEY
jgi:hypothetical protein